MADQKISEFPVADALSREEELPLVQSGVTKKVKIKELTSGGIILTAGSLEGPPIPEGTIFYGISSRNYNLTGWRLLVSPTGSVTLSVRKCVFASFPPLVGDKISGTGDPEITSDVTAQSDDLSLWTDTQINKTDAIAVVVEANDNVSWFSLELLGE